MFVRAKRAGGHTYLQLVASQWKNGKPRQQVLATLGRQDRLRASGQLARLIASARRFLGPMQVDEPPVDPRTAADAQALVIDADPRTSRLVASALPDPWKVTTCADPLVGLVTAGLLRPRLVVFDLYPHGLDGYVLCHHLHETPELAQATLVALSPTPTAGAEERCKAHGARALLSSPLDPAALLALVPA